MAKAEEVWRRVVPGDAMYNPELDMAALIRADGSFAVLIPNPSGSGGIVGFGLVADGYEDQITSVLRAPNGQVSTRTVAVPELVWRGAAQDGAVTYLFPISAAEVDLFKSALSWCIKFDGSDATFLLTGSLRAITAAQKAKDARAKLLRRITGGG